MTRKIFIVLGLAACLATIFALRHTSTLAPMWGLARRGGYFVAYLVEPRDPPIFVDDFDVFNPSLNPAKRIFLFHGLRADRSYWQEPPRDQMIARLMANGFQIFAFDLPYARADFFKDGGTTYCSQFLHWFRETRKKIATSFGAAREEIVIGESWGGLHALIAAAGSDVQGYAALYPVVDISRLQEFWMVRNANCDPVAAASILANRNGFLSWGTADDRVDFRKTLDLANQIRSFDQSRLSTFAFEGADHGSVTGGYQPVLAWLGVPGLNH